MLQVQNLTKSYGAQLLLDHVSFTIGPGERIGLVGRNGHGKTTLFRMILGEVQPDAGQIRIPRDYTIGHLSQQLEFSEETLLGEGCLTLRRSEDGRDDTYKVKAVLQGLGFSESDFDRHPFALSGGYQVRLNLAKVLVSEPHLLLLDEPTNYLDIVSIRWLTRFLLDWPRELMLITHDRTFMDAVTTHTLGIHRSRCRKIAGPTAKLYNQLAQEEEIHERTRVNEEKKRKETEQFINRFRAKATKARAVQSRVKLLERQGRLERLNQIENLDFAFRACPFHGKTLLGTEALSFSYGHDAPLLIDRLGFSVRPKDRIAVVGQNGKGKSTLLKLLAGELTPVAGRIEHHPHLQPAYFGQSAVGRLPLDHTVEEEILSVHPDGNRTAVRGICGAMMFDGDKALKKIQVLSGGEKSRVLLGKLLVTPCNLLLLDEPSNHLDLESTEALIDALQAFDGALIIVTHVEQILHAVATRLIIFDAGVVRVFEGSYSDFLDRVGWSHERPEVPGNNKPQDRSGSVSRKALRRRRAAVIAERSRTLGLLLKRIAAVEKEIMTLERCVEEETNALLQASQRGDAPLIERHAKSIHHSRDRIDALFSELESLTEEHDVTARRFEEQLNSF